MQVADNSYNSYLPQFLETQRKRSVFHNGLKHAPISHICDCKIAHYQHILFVNKYFIAKWQTYELIKISAMEGAAPLAVGTEQWSMCLLIDLLKVEGMEVRKEACAWQHVSLEWEGIYFGCGQRETRRRERAQSTLTAKGVQ